MNIHFVLNIWLFTNSRLLRKPYLLRKRDNDMFELALPTINTKCNKIHRKAFFGPQLFFTLKNVIVWFVIKHGFVQFLWFGWRSNRRDVQ